MDEQYSSKEDKLCSVLRTRLHAAEAAYSTTRQNQQEDRKFYAGSPDNNYQWPYDALATRGNAHGETKRPTLTINKLPQHVKQVTNDQKQNRPGGKVIPANEDADVQVAEVFDGMVRYIEYVSEADIAYDKACENQVIHGEGYWRIITEYEQGDTFDQCIKIKAIKDSFSVVLDPRCEHPCGKDAEWGVIHESVLKDDFERQWPNAKPISTLKSSIFGDELFKEWIGENTIRIAEYYYKEYEYYEICLYPGGNIARKGSDADKVFRENYGRPIKSRKVKQPVVKWCKTNGYEILEETMWPGAYIPIIRVVGEEITIDGELSQWGLIRNAKDAQRMYNYWTSQEAEMLALAPKAPFIGYAGQFEGHEDKWATANTRNWPYLEVNPDVTDSDGKVLPLPQRSMPPMAQTGLIQAKLGAADDIKGTTGQYDASLGQVSNERSGKAIMARQREGDTGTYHFQDNLAKAIRFSTLQLVDLIPKVYDTRRIVEIIGEEDKDIKRVQLDPTQPEALNEITDSEGNVIERIYNPAVGKYDVRTAAGAGYATARQEALDAMSQILQGNPELMQAAGDLFAKNMDWPGAQEFAERLRRMVPPELLDDGQSPELQQAQQQIQDLTQTVQQMQNMLENVQNSFEAREVEVKERKADVDEYKAETDRMQAMEQAMTPEQVQMIIQQTVAEIMAQPAPQQTNTQG